MLPLELLAPARTLEIGIAAIDCGADAVYIAGPAFGARQAAGNSVEDIAKLCAYAHRFGARIFVTLNTILYEEELAEARRLIGALTAAGADGLIVQDLAVPQLAGPDSPLRLHASTQCAIRTPEKARRYEAMGFSRLVLERELSLAEVRAIREAVSCELEFFVHGALCVCYSGQCYLSEALTGRSANRGACAQACRSRYDLVDADGKVLVRNKALLSLKDYNLLQRVGELAEAGVCSLKIEGRLKGLTYVKNTVRAYSEALDELVRRFPDRYRRAAFGHVSGGFLPDLAKTFNRGYTELFFDGARSRGWSSMDAPTSLGEPVGRVRTVSPGRPGTAGGGGRIELKDLPAGIRLRNGDGFAFSAPDGEVVGFRGDVCDGAVIRGDIPAGIRPGTPLYRNSDSAFEKAVEAGRCVREISVQMDVTISSKSISINARSEDGREIHLEKAVSGEPARDRERLVALVRGQLGKRAGHYTFTVAHIDATAQPLPLMPASFLNALRREIADALDALPVRAIPLGGATPGRTLRFPEAATYKDNIANPLARQYYAGHGSASQEAAYELTHRPGAELMRTRYCLRYELGMCPVHQGAPDPGPLFLLNNGRRLPLRFDCRACEMAVLAPEGSIRE